MLLLFVSLTLTSVIQHDCTLTTETPASNGSIARPPRNSPSFDEICHDRERIVGGQPAHIEEAPYQVSIRYPINPDVSPWDIQIICGGSLIAPDVILSAGHCFQRLVRSAVGGASRFAVILGSTFRKLPSAGAQIRAVRKIVIHHGYQTLPLVQNDVALMLLEQPVEMSEFVSVVPLADVTAKTGMKCLITGYGRIKFSSAEHMACLMKAVVPVLDIEECRRRSSLTIGKGIICAGYFEGGIDSCVGDSGGPLVCDGVQYGIVSFGKGCAMVNESGFYTDVAVHRDWIRKYSSGCRVALSVGLATLQMVFVCFVILKS